MLLTKPVICSSDRKQHVALCAHEEELVWSGEFVSDKPKPSEISALSFHQCPSFGTVVVRTVTQVSAGAHRLSVLGWTPPHRTRAQLVFAVWRRERLDACGEGQRYSFAV